MFVLLHGAAAVSVSQNGSMIRVGSLHMGDCFGEMSLLTGEKRTATVAAEQDCEVIEIAKPAMAAVLRDAPDVVTQLSELLATRKMETEGLLKDAGQTMRELGIALEEEFGGRPIKLTLLISHTHWDHIQGLPFFRPAFNESNSIRILGYEGARAGLGTILAGQMETPFFPVSLHQLPSHLAIQELKDMDKLGISSS